MSFLPTIRYLIMPVVLATTTLVFATPAFAHSVNKRFGDFYGGMLHPLTAVEHLFPMIGISLLAGQQGPQRAQRILVSFPIGLLAGAIVANYQGPSLYVEWVNRISFVVVGILVAASMRIPVSGLVAIALCFGFTHGYENTADISQTVAMRMFVPGVLTSGFALTAILAATAVTLSVPWQQTAVRVAGSWIAAMGLLTIGVA